MAIYALVKDGVVINTIVWDGKDLEFDEGIESAEIPEGEIAGIGWLYADGKFTQPAPTQEEIDQKKKQDADNNVSLKSILLAQATTAIAPLQDAVDLDEATDAEIALLKKWKQYRIAINRIDANTSDEIVWPDQPA